MKTNRRDFVKMGTAAGVGVAGMVLTESNVFGANKGKSKEPDKHDPNIVRVGYIGIGGRGSGHVHDSMAVGGVEIVAVCDISQLAINKVQAMVVKNGMKPLNLFRTRSEQDIAVPLLPVRLQVLPQ